MLPKLPPHKRIKAKYNATPTEREKAYHEWLMDAYDCICGCGGKATFVHHPLERHPAQRWRRDHEFVVPMTDHCHRALHAEGSEAKYDPDNDYPSEALAYRALAKSGGLL
jgi:hypothetical protein